MSQRPNQSRVISEHGTYKIGTDISVMIARELGALSAAHSSWNTSSVDGVSYGDARSKPLFNRLQLA